jgi:hypothetical protein
MPTQLELEEMERDFIQMDREKVEQICFEVMKERLYNYEAMKEELRLLKSGENVILPVNMDHARFMLLIAQHYISESHKDLMNTIKG